MRWKIAPNPPPARHGDTMTTGMTGRSRRWTNVALWALQIVLSLMFLFAGGSKLVMSSATLASQSPLSIPFLRFVGVLEVLGGLGLVLPGVLHLRPWLTPLAAAGLVIIMSGAVGATMAMGKNAEALFPVFVGLMLAIVVVGRGRMVLRGGMRSGVGEGRDG